ncbi:MAG TPA: hypothetical protein VIH59_16840 [Candidatus Tectomicrobia bacterium]|jgi:hypothetical protein
MATQPRRGSALPRSARGVFARLLAQRRTAGLTGDQLLAQVHNLHSRSVVKAVATLQRLEAFLAAIPSSDGPSRP